MNGFIATFLRKPVMCTMMLSALCMLGVISIFKLPVGLMPNLSSPGITIITRWSGVAAGKVEEIITIPVERVVSDIPGIEKMLSTSSDGESKINLIFAHDADIMVKIVEASERIYLIRDQFPREVEQPSIIQYDPTNKPVYIMSFSSERYDLKDLREIVDKQIKLQFERIEGVSEVFVGGGFEREIQVTADPLRMSAHGISVQPLVQEIGSGNFFVPGGKLPATPGAAGGLERNVYTAAKYKSIEEMQKLFVPGEQGLMRLRQLADVRDHYRERDSISRTNGEDRVTLYIQKAGSASTLNITDACVEIYNTLKIKDIETHEVYNQGESIRDAINQVTGSCVVGGLIAVMVLYAFLRKMMMTLVIALTIPASILTTLFLMFMSGIDLNVMSLSGLALGAGMLIDNSIVVSENIDVHVARSDNLFDGVLAGTSEVFVEIISATLTTIVIFIPLIFTEPETRQLYMGLSATVTYSLLVSLVFSLTILPAFLLVVFKKKQGEEEFDLGGWLGDQSSALIVRGFAPGSFGERLSRRLPDSFTGFVARHWRSGSLGKFFNIDRLTKRYRILCRYVFRHIRYSLSIPIVFLALTPLLFQYIPKEYMSPVAAKEIEASVDLDTGIHLDRTEKVVSEIEKAVSEHPSVKELTSKIEKWHATMHIKLNPESGLDADETIEELRKVTEQFDEAFVYFDKAGEGGGSRELNIDFYGDNIKVLKEFASECSGKIQGNIKGVKQVVLRFRGPKSEIRVRPYTTKSALSGTSSQEIGSTVRQLLTGTIITKYYDKNREVDVRLIGMDKIIETPEQLYAMLLPLQERTVPLRSLAGFSKGEEETRIWRKNKRKAATITVVLENRSIDKVADEIDVLFRKMDFPEDVIYAYGEEYKKLKENQLQMLLAIGLSIVIIYLLLGALFESFAQPLLILITVPLTITAVLAFLIAIKMSLSTSVYIGLIMLGGIVVNNSILVVSAINSRFRGENPPELSKNPLSAVRHVLKESSSRVRPILMTTMTTVFGMLPMALDPSEESNLWRPLATTVSFGMTFSLLISLAVVPFACYMFYRVQSIMPAARQAALAAGNSGQSAKK